MDKFNTCAVPCSGLAGCQYVSVVLSSDSRQMVVLGLGVGKGLGLEVGLELGR